MTTITQKDDSSGSPQLQRGADQHVADLQQGVHAISLLQSENRQKQAPEVTETLLRPYKMNECKRRTPQALQGPETSLLPKTAVLDHHLR